jgi:serine/threonine protein kinase, bacterial
MSFHCSQGHSNATDSRFCRLCGEPLQLSPQAIGQLLGYRYQVVSELGQGGFGRTYLAEDTHRFNERCVLKEYAPQVQGEQALQKAEELFAREAGILYQLQHPQIPRFREFFRADWQGRDRLFLVQDFVDGQTYHDLLRDRQSREDCFSEAELVQLLLQSLPVLDYIHSAGVIHRDISPDNLICRRSDGLPVLIDYGGVKQVVAKVLSATQPLAPVNPKAVTRLGKAGYAPPEQLEQGEVYPHSDLYALAVTGLVLRTGKEPQALFPEGDRREWQRQGFLSPSCQAIVAQMLDPYPAKRFQSAQAVLSALEKAGFGVAGSIQESPRAWATPTHPTPIHNPDPATLVVSPGFPTPPTHATVAIASGAPVSAVPSSQEKKSTRPNARTQRVASWVLVAGLLMGGWWIGVKWLGPALRSKLPDIIPSNPANKGNKQPTKTSNSAKIPDSAFSQTEQDRKQQLGDRRQQLGINETFLANLVNALFYTKHPNLAGQKLGAGEADAGLRQDWDEMALQTLNQLEALSPEARSRLGQYTNADVRDRQQTAAQLNVSGRALNDLTDAQFFHAFPDQARGEKLLSKAIGQVWQAIATDQLNGLQNGQRLQQVQFQKDNFSDRLSGTLKPGEGKTYVANLGANQTLKLQLQPTNKSVRLSLYPPTSKAPALLEDSQETEWSGKLTEPGFYEIVIVSDSPEAVNYTLDLSAAEQVTQR